MFRNLLMIHIGSSEIHEKMCCNRCKTQQMTSTSSSESNDKNDSCSTDEEDIGGFAGIAGCFNNLKFHEKQVTKHQNILIIVSTKMLFC